MRVVQSGYLADDGAEVTNRAEFARSRPPPAARAPDVVATPASGTLRLSSVISSADEEVCTTGTSAVDGLLASEPATFTPPAADTAR